MAEGGKRKLEDLSIAFWEDFWSGYAGPDSKGDGIGDVPYHFEGGEDKFPLMDHRENYSCIEGEPSKIFSSVGGLVPWRTSLPPTSVERLN